MEEHADKESVAEIRNASLCISAIIRKLSDGKLTDVSALFEINAQNVRIQRALASILKESKV